MDAINPEPYEYMRIDLEAFSFQDLYEEDTNVARLIYKEAVYVLPIRWEVVQLGATISLYNSRAKSRLLRSKTLSSYVASREHSFHGASG